MKKFTLFIAALFFVGAANAQDMTSKRGINILPEAGDLSISINADPFLTYAGSVISNTGGATAPGVAFFNNVDQVIGARYFLSETAAIRGYVRIGIGSDSDKRNENNLDGNAVELENTMSQTNVTIGGGYEIRRGNYGRFQGYYGGEAYFTIAGTNNETQALAGNDINTTEVSTSAIAIGAHGFIGVEYFFAPKVSLSGEVSWGFVLNSEGDTETSVTGSDTVTTPGGSSFSLDTGRGVTNGQLRLNFLF